MAAGPRAELRLAALPPVLARAEAAGRDWLSSTERDRLGAMRSPRRRQQYLAGHWLLRCLAAECFGGEAADYLIETTDAGAPRLRARHGDAVHFASISHSGDWIAVALAPFAIGVDIECTHKARDWLALAQAFCSARELALLRGLQGEERAALFHRLWTAKEAIGKRDGHGLKLEHARRQSLCSCAPDAAELLCWPLGGGSLALAGAAGVQANVVGIEDGARAGAYRVDRD